MLKITRILISEYLQRFQQYVSIQHGNSQIVHWLYFLNHHKNQQTLFCSVVKSNSGSKMLNSLIFWKQSKEYCSQYSFLFEKLHLTFQQYVSIQHGNSQSHHHQASKQAMRWIVCSPNSDSTASHWKLVLQNNNPN